MRKNEIIKFLLIIIFLVMMPRLVSAAVEISEIMYDPKDTDANAGGEWIEIHNTDSQIIDLTQWIFFENDINHKITADNAAEVPAGGYAVISSNLDYFKSFFTNYSGLLFKASFSLNDGEPLAMKSSKDVTPSDSVTYSSDWGGKNDGNSLQKISGQWKVGIPTPGVANVANSSPNNNPQANEQSAGSPNQSSGVNQTSSTGNSEKPPEIKVEIVANKTAVVGADALLSGKTLGADGKPLENVRFLWNFGDGETKEGQNVLHRFRFPGEYIVTLDVAYGKWSATARLTVTAVKSPLKISRAEEGLDGFVEIVNEGNTELDLFGWYLKSDNIYFLIPKNTMVASGKKIIFPNEITKLVGDEAGVLLLYPNGVIAANYEKPAPASTPPVIVEKPVEKKPVDLPNLELGETKMPVPAEETETVAAVYGAEPAKNNLLIWFLALGGLIVISLGALIFTKKQPVSSAGEYEIIE